MMKFLKAIASGFATLTGAALLISIPLVAAILKYSPKDGYYFEIHWHLWRMLVVSVVVFSIGFLWKYCRAR